MLSDCSDGWWIMGSLWWYFGNLIGIIIELSMFLIRWNVVMFFDVCVIILRNEVKCIKIYMGLGVFKRSLRDIFRRVCLNLYILEFM